MATPFHVTVLTPERTIFEGEAIHLLAPGSEGYLGVLAHHAPLLTSLRPGLLEIGSSGAERRRYFVRGGFAEVGPSGLTVLAKTAIDLTELEADMLNLAIKDAEEDIADAKDEGTRDRARTQLDHLHQVQATLNL